MNYILNDLNRKKVIDFKANNLHVVGYFIPINKTVTPSDLQEHLYSLPNQPTAIPHVNSYYKEFWGFCIKYNDRLRLKDGKYKVFIDNELKDGSITCGELIILVVDKLKNAELISEQIGARDIHY